jgi:hypothetical protein
MLYWLLRLFGIRREQSKFVPQPGGPLPAPIRRKVLAIIHNPVMQSRGGRKLNQVFGWNDPDTLVQGYIEDLRTCSYGYANYEIVERIEVDGYPLKLDKFVYDETSYLSAWDTRKFHQPDACDYLRLVADFDVINKINSGAIDEVWLFGFPYTGYFESIMGGPGAFWCNSSPLRGTEHASRRFVMMGFNYERGVGEMLEAFNHRVESIMMKVFENRPGDANLWERFTRYDQKYPGRAEVGNVHFAPNSVKDYDWGNTRYVMSKCDDWYNFPNFKGTARQVNCSEWGNGDIREYHRWWLRHLPHITGESAGISYNWWEYILDPHRVAQG